jgi:hypothetical protein
METLDDPAQALRWYREAVRAADLIADDEQPHMHLYRSLCRCVVISPSGWIQC